MEFQPPYFPPPFPGAQGGSGDVFSQHLASDPYQHYAVSCTSRPGPALSAAKGPALLPALPRGGWP